MERNEAAVSQPISDREIPRRAGDPGLATALGRYAAGATPPDDPLEAGRVRQALRERTAHVYGAERAETLDPLADAAAVAGRLALAGAVAEETAAGRPLPRLALAEIRPALQRASIEGAVLETDELGALHGFLSAAAEVEACAAEAENPRLAEFLGGFARPEELVRHLDRIMDPAGGIRDQASAELAAARSGVRQARDRVRGHLEQRAQSSALRSLLQDTRVTLRQGRYVLPVKAESQGRVKGVVHAASGSGETVFMEPLDAVSLNNALEKAESEALRAEYQVRVLATRAVARAREEMEGAVGFLGLLDLLQAGERLRADLGGTIPELADGPEFALEAVAHPLLVLEHGQEGVVPTDLALGGDDHCLVVSGPNTGGKTVLLKTVGLAHWMAYCGLPVAGRGRVGRFSDLWAVIGDQQSLAADLSTFSAQLVRLKGVLEGLDEHRLVLIDELGSGTNPGEGSALGVAVLERLRQAGAVALVSTHLDRLKHYAVRSPGVINAALSFDVERLAPTYQVEWAQAGRSQALEIAERLGLPDDLLEAAREALGEETQEVERLLAERDRLLAEANRERDEATAARQRAEAAEREARALRERLAAEREEAFGKVEAEWQQTLEGARREVREIIRHLKESGNTAAADEALARLDQQFRRQAPTEQAEPAIVEEGPKVAVGDRGRLAPFRKAGEVVAVDHDRGEVEMDLGGKRVRGDLANFQRTEAAAPRPEEPAPEPAGGGTSGRGPALPESTRLDLRGQRRDEALATLQHFLDNAYGAGLGQVTVLHGKGTGVLAEAVQQALTDDPRVARFGHARPEEGGAGVTEVEFKKGG
ncbi:endonuclease MutS2 [Thiohalorhabdus denitrificans]|uniref:Endonuclease MutS2 n=1 Tax=Thiohalorhabdus denitrificans TaxID=381306 RepID=A0A1G5FRA3_9GAMM|nr:Smr/MutS family protein [Thiohalorhabdus denitrificans]SCY41674.1 DNA mismatch repair protein MutS2 [Thiohalorhabdus denitrificans]